MKIRILSPHPDDAVWSLGGWIQRHAVLHDEVEVVTVFNRLGPVGTPQSQCADAWRQLGLEELRSAEDQKALRILNATAVSLGLTDAAARIRPDGAWEVGEPADLTMPDRRATAKTAERLTAALRSLAPADLTVAPLGLGGHRDHVLVQHAAQALWGTTGTLRWYAEFPYALDQRLEVCHRQELVRVAWQPWLQAALAYRSQILRIFQGQQRFVLTLRRYASLCEGDSDCIARIFDTVSTYLATEPVAESSVGSA